MAEDDNDGSELAFEGFWFNYGGYWEKKESWCYEEVKTDFVEGDTVDSMTFEKIVAKYAELGYPNPKCYFVQDSNETYENGLYAIYDEESTRRVLDLAFICCWEEVCFYIDDERLPFPSELVSRVRGLLDVEEIEKLERLQANGESGKMKVVEGEGRDGDKAAGIVGDGRDGVKAAGFVGEGRDGDIDCGIQMEANDGDTSAAFEGEGRDGVQDWGIQSLDSEGEGRDGEGAEDRVQLIDGAEDNMEDDGEDDEDDDTYFVHDEDSDGDEEYDEQVLEDENNPSFELGQNFESAKAAREAVNLYAVQNGYKIHFVKNEKTRLRAICLNAKKCHFMFYCSKITPD